MVAYPHPWIRRRGGADLAKAVEEAKAVPVLPEDPLAATATNHKKGAAG